MSAATEDMRERLKRWPLVAQPSNRSESFLKDARIVNGFIELDPNTGEQWVQKRIGYTAAFSGLVTLGLGRGMYTWYQTGGPAPIPTNYCVIGNGASASLFKNGVLTGTNLGLIDSGGNWGWTETQGATRYLVFAGVGIGGGSNLYYSTGSGWSLATLPANRGSYILGLAYLDGTVYFMDELCQIFGSALEDPSTWTTTNMIPAKKIPGTGIALQRQGPYLIALKTSSMEVFFDASGPPPGSVLQQIDGSTNTYGCVDHDTVQNIDGIIIYATSNQNASPQIVRIDNLTPTIISSPAVERMLDIAQTGSFYSWVFKHGGHRFYGITSTIVGATFVYDIDAKGWFQWTAADGTYFPIQSVGISATFGHYFLATTQGNVFSFAGDFTYSTDNGAIAAVDIYTPNEDFGTRRRKTLHRMYIRSDQTPGSLLYTSHSDNDYKTWSTPRKVDLSAKTPYIDNEGTFIRRAYRFRHQAATPFRIRSADLQMDVGTI